MGNEVSARSEAIRVLLIEDDPIAVLLLREQLAEARNTVFNIESFDRLQTGLTRLLSDEVDIVLLDLNLPDSCGLDTLRELHARELEVPILVLTGLDDEMTGIKAVQEGAQDYLIKGRIGGDSMARCICYAIERYQMLVELRRQKQALQASEQRLRRVIEQNADAMAIIDQGGVVRFMNPATESLLGPEAGKFLGGLLKFPAVASGKIETEIPREDGETVTAEMRVTTIEWEDELAYLASLRDITERKRAEQALEEERASLAERVKERTEELRTANAELARAARLKDEFLASMSHELRTPLNAILGMSESLREGIYGTLGQEQIMSLNSIEESGRHLLALINDILDVSKMEVGKLELETSEVTVRSVCQASLEFIKQDAQKKELKVSSSFDSAVTTLQADERRLKEILVNLLNNAVKFTPEGGEVGLDFAGDAEQEMVHFTVWDTGIGISQEDMELLFRPFIQLDGSLSRQHSGTGLGLALVKKMIELHGGSVSVESEVGRGSRFTVSLPWERRAEATENARRAEPAESSVPIEGRTLSAVMAEQKLEREQPLVLMAEDNETAITMTSDFLSFAGYRVVAAHDGSEAVQRTKEEKPDILLMDIQMPGMDGLEAIRRIRTDADLADMPIIALTALAMPGDLERCLEAGANYYMSKPFSLRALMEVIETQLCREPSRKG